MNYYKKIPSLLLLVFLGIEVFGQLVNVTGHVYSRTGDSLSAVTVTITVDNEVLTTTTDEQGNYSFLNVPQSAIISLKPVNVMNPLNGVSTFDVVLGFKHALGIVPFDSAANYLAMDVNKSGSVTALDLVLIRRLILGLTPDFPDTEAWRFVEEKQLAAITFDQSKMPEYDTNIPAIEFSPNDDGTVVLNFVGIKIGDANGSAAF